MSSAMLYVFWVSIAALAYSQFGYVAALAAVSRFLRWPVQREPIRPFVSLVLPVHNGDSQISRKIGNLCALNYPSDRLEIIVVDDCSTDSTLARVACACSTRASQLDISEPCLAPPIRMVRLPRWSGKAAALNVGLKIAKGDIIGFTDVAAILDAHALAAAVERFADPTVGCVSSEDEIERAGGIAAGECLYSRLETLARRYESDICCATGCNGSFYLVRRELCTPFPLDVATDLFSALHCVNKGYRAVVEPEAKVRLAAQPIAAHEFERKVRTMVTGLRALAYFAALLNPFRAGLYSVFLACHKLVRYLTPLFAAAALTSTVYLAFSIPVFRWLFYFEAALLCIGSAQIVIQTLTSKRGLAGLPAFLCAATAAAAAAWYRYMTGERYETWQPTDRRTV